MHISRTSVALMLAVAASFGGWVAATHTVTAIEFYNDGLKRYLITADPNEAATLDAAVLVNGWVRTGGQFTAYTFPWLDRAPVCRLVARQSNTQELHVLTADADVCALAKHDSTWTYDRAAFFLQTPTAKSCPAGTLPVWRSRLTAANGEVNYRYTTDLTAHSRTAELGLASDDLAMCAPVSEAEREADVVRLLEQSTLGPTEALAREVRTRGISRWIDEQLSLNVTRYTQYPYKERLQNGSFAFLCVDDPTPPVTPDKSCHTYKISPSPVGWEFFRQSRTAPDQLRLRMAHVWHQIFVTSDGNGTYAYADFQQRLRDNVFGTFENLLLRFALSPQLGEYQNWVRNLPEHDGIRPNENFARELMQLFTIGVNELNDDGTVKLDGNGQLIPTYEQVDIETLARILTGFTFPPEPGSAPRFLGPNHYIGEMVPYDEYHDRGAKRLLKGAIDLPEGGGAMAEVRAAIHALALHPNTPPFISKQLIQKLVTSAPTPGYVARVAAVFKDNGEGVRGDLAAVTRAILLDPEARGARKIDPEYGRMREPVLFWTAMLRGLDVTTDGVIPYALSANSGQLLFLAPSVFNYYPSDYALAGGAVPAPEFGIFTSTEFLKRANQVNELLHNVDKSAAELTLVWAAEPHVVNATGTPSPPLTAFLPDAGDADALVDRIDRLFLHGTMRPAMRKVIVSAVSTLPPEEALRRVKLALQLTLSSVDYQIQR